MTIPQGRNVCARDLENIEGIVRKHLLTAGREQLSVAKAYRKLVDKYYSIELAQERIPLPAHERPTLDQFRYHARKLTGSSSAYASRAGALIFRQHHRPALGSPGLHLPGPGIYQIDATELDARIASALDLRTDVGRPWLYVVRDWWSRCIVGIHVSLSPPSHATAAMALRLAFTDLTEIVGQLRCPQFLNSLPAGGICSLVLGDRGEMFGKVPTSWVIELGIGVANLPPRAPDWKGIVEHAFALITDWGVAMIEGSQTKSQRARRLPKTPPLLSLRHLWMVLLATVRALNARVVPMDELDALAIAAPERPFTYRSLFEWGQVQWGSPLRTWDTKMLRILMFPRTQVQPATRGINLNTLYYLWAEGLDAGRFLRRTGRVAPMLEVAWNPLNVGEAYLISTDGSAPMPLTLVDKYLKFAGLSLSELRRLRIILGAEWRVATERALVTALAGDSDIRTIVRKAREERLALGTATALDLLTLVAATPEHEALVSEVSSVYDDAMRKYFDAA